MLGNEAIEEFKQIFFEEEGIMLSDEEATEKALSVFNFFKAVFSSLPDPTSLTKNVK